MHRIGVISDTHRLIRPDAITALQGVEHILHAGDIGLQIIIYELGKIAPVTAVRGNVDAGDWARSYPSSAVVELYGHIIYILHDIKNLELDPCSAGFSAVIYGHSHIAQQEKRDGILYFNPGSAGPRRFSQPVTVGLLLIDSEQISGEIITLDT